MNLLRAIGAVLLPPRCACEAAIGLNVEANDGLCDTCRSVLTPAANSPDVCAPFAYGGPLKSVVAAAKFQRRERSARCLGRLLAADLTARELMGEVSALVPIPLSPLRHYRRGFNQAALIAAECSKAWAIPVRTFLRRTRETPAQSSLSREERKANVSGAFSVKGKLPATVALVDDVVTTGATMDAAASTLRAAGVQSVIRLAVCLNE